MVSLRKKFGVYFFISALVLVCLLMPAELKASQQCCKNGKLTTCPNLPNGQQYDLSGCQLGLGPVVDPDRPVIIDPDKPIIIGPIESECTSGQKENKYTASGCSYSTSTRTCCSDGTWSPWDASCPTTKTCPTASKPDSKTTCYGGYQRRTVTCNTSTGTWTTGSWGDCDCSDSEFESVTTLSGGTCCQRKDGTGLLCAAGQETIGHRWESFGTSYGCTGGCPAGTPVDGAPCPDYWAGSFCTTHHSWSERGEEICNQFYCR